MKVLYCILCPRWVHALSTHEIGKRISTNAIQVVQLVSPFNSELSFIMAAVLWSDRFVNKKLRKFKHRRRTL